TVELMRIPDTGSRVSAICISHSIHLLYMVWLEVLYLNIFNKDHSPWLNLYGITRYSQDNLLFWVFYIERNKRYGVCPSCKKFNTNIAWCKSCDTSVLISQFENWTSGDKKIDKFIQNTQRDSFHYKNYLEYIPFDRFKDVKYLAKGGFSTVYQATWLDGFRTFYKSHKNRLKPKSVVLKTFPKITGKDKYCLKEIIAHQNVTIRRNGRRSDAIHPHGITCHPHSMEFFMIFDYAKEGNLRQYLRNNYHRIKWIDKLRILKEISKQLFAVHTHGFLHNDLHSGNVLFSSQGKSFVFDFGLAEKISENSNDLNQSRIPG
ncbi:355_t:CDS:2, partial [Dentiscutata erythropus]